MLSYIRLLPFVPFFVLQIYQYHAQPVSAQVWIEATFPPSGPQRLGTH